MIPIFWTRCWRMALMSQQRLRARRDEPTKVACPPVELSLTDQAWEQGQKVVLRQKVVLHQAQELALVCYCQPVLGNGQCAIDSVR